MAISDEPEKQQKQQQQQSFITLKNLPSTFHNNDLLLQNWEKN